MSAGSEVRTLNTAQAHQNIADQAQFMGSWLDEQTLRDEFDAIIAAAWPAQQTSRTSDRIPQTGAHLIPPLPHPQYDTHARRPASRQGDRGIEQHGRERSPPPAQT